MHSEFDSNLAHEVFDDCHGLFPHRTVAEVLRVVLAIQSPDLADRAQLRRLARRLLTTRAIARARAAGVTAVWAADHSATVDLVRLGGEHDAILTQRVVERLELIAAHPARLADPRVRVAVYEHYLVNGSPFDIYHWVNLIDLAAVMPTLRLPDGLRADWHQALDACGLLPPEASARASGAGRIGQRAVIPAARPAPTRGARGASRAVSSRA